jgi:hypothetical protein
MVLDGYLVYVGKQLSVLLIRHPLWSPHAADVMLAGVGNRDRCYCFIEPVLHESALTGMHV